MSGLAEILIKEGFTVSGSDIHRSPITDHLEEKGAKIFISRPLTTLLLILISLFIPPQSVLTLTKNTKKRSRKAFLS